MPTLPTGRQSHHYDEDLVATLTTRVSLTAPELLEGATDHSAGDDCPCCNGTSLYGKPPYQCRACGWSSIQNHFDTPPAPKAPAVRDAFTDSSIHPHTVAAELVDTEEDVENRLIKAGYLGYPTEFWSLDRDAWQTQYTYYGTPDLLAYLLRDAYTVFALVSAADSGYDDFDEYRNHVKTRPRRDIGADPAKNAIETLFWLEGVGAPTDPEEVSIFA